MWEQLVMARQKWAHVSYPLNPIRHNISCCSWWHKLVGRSSFRLKLMWSHFNRQLWQWWRGRHCDKLKFEQCGLDLYTSSWNEAANNALPGERWCSVQMTSKNIFTFDGYVCYHATGETSNEWYRNVGLHWMCKTSVWWVLSLMVLKECLNRMRPIFSLMDKESQTCLWCLHFRMARRIQLS